MRESVNSIAALHFFEAWISSTIFLSKDYYYPLSAQDSCPEAKQ